MITGEIKNRIDTIWDTWKTRARVTPRADKALTPDIFYD